MNSAVNSHVNVTPRSLVQIYRRFEGFFSLYVVEERVTRSSETSVNFSCTTQCHIPEVSDCVTELTILYKSQESPVTS